MKLVSILPSTKPSKKLMATFDVNGRRKITHFGARGMADYTLTHDTRQRDLYRERHRRDLDTGDPTRAGLLSWFILWGDSTSRKRNIREFRRRFNF
jgi:hypothetical protein